MLDAVLSVALRVYRRLPNKTGGTNEILYPLELFMRNNYFLERYNIDIASKSVLEIGCGDGLTLGYLYLCSGAKSWTGVDQYPYAIRFDKSKAVQTINKWLELEDYFPVLAKFKSWPFHFKKNKTFSSSIAESDLCSMNERIHYMAPWNEEDISGKRFHLVYSQAVFEHVSKPQDIYNTIAKSLEPGGIFINHIDFKSHGMSFFWNGHYRYPQWLARLLNSSYSFRYLNLLSPLDHLVMLEASGLKILDLLPLSQNDELNIKSLSAVGNSKEAEISSLVIIAQK